jgi:MFS family permease
MSGARVPSEALADAPAMPAEGEPAPPPRAPAWTVLRPLFSDSAYRAALIGSAAGFFLSGALQTLIPSFWVDVLHRPKGAVGTPFTVLALASLIVVWHAGSVSDRRGRKFAYVPSLALMAVATLALGYTSAPGMLIGLVAVIGIGSGYARPGPTAIVADVAAPGARGVAVSGYRTAGDIGALLGPIIVGVVAQTVGYRWAFTSTALFTLIAFVVAALARETAPRMSAAAG